jgi:uncharacterized RDD family membrane protein YckC
MRCPKCHYISFEAGDRCRNCGYEFSLSVDVGALDLPIQTGREPIGPLSDLSLANLDAPQAAELPTPRVAASLELPLFKDRTPDDDRPLVTQPAVPRPPLAVRKSTPIAPRPAARPRVEEPELDLGPPEPGIEFDACETALPRPANGPAAAMSAPLGRRAAAWAIDAALLGLIDLVVLYFTLRLCGLQFDEIGAIAPVPFLSFVLLQNGGYFAAFIALGGQTIGKMALGIKVVPAAATDAWNDRVPLGTSALRAAFWILTVLPAGVGLLPALFSADHRTVHDRLAGTRVVRA